MKRLGLVFSLISTLIFPANASDVKLSQLPIGNASSVINADSFPITNSTAGVTQRLLFGDIINLPQLTGTLLQSIRLFLWAQSLHLPYM